MTRFEAALSHDLLLSASFDPASVSAKSGVAVVGPTLALVPPKIATDDAALAHLVASSSRLVVPVTSSSAAAAVRSVLIALAKQPGKLFAQRVADCHELVSLLTSTTAAAAACQQWTFTLDGASAATGAQLQVPFVQHAALVRSRAAALFAGGATAPAARLEQADGRAALQKLLGRVGMAPVEQEAALGVVNAAVRLSELRFYPPTSKGKPPPYANDASAKAARGAAQALGVDEKSLFAALLADATTADDARAAAVALAEELLLRLLRWTVDHVNLYLRATELPAVQPPSPAAAAAAAVPRRAPAAAARARRRRRGGRARAARL